MIKRIVVPLDQTEATKTVLNVAVWLALLFEARLLLLGISNIPPKVARQVHPAHRDIIPSGNPDSFRENYAGHWAYPLYFPDTAVAPLETVNLNSVDEAKLEIYLSNLQSELTGSHLHHKLRPGQISLKIINGPMDQALKELAAIEPIDLVVLAANQESGLKQYLISSQPNQILRQAQLPVLVVPQGLKNSSLRQFENETVTASLKLFFKPVKSHILVTLDDTNEAEAALPLAAECAKKMNIPLYLLLVLPIASGKGYIETETSLPFKIGSDPDEQYDFAYTYLCRIQQDLISRGINCHRVLLEGKADQRIVNYIERTRPILTILATHAYPKLGQILLGSVAQKIIKASSRLVLLVPNTLQSQPVAVLEGGCWEN